MNQIIFGSKQIHLGTVALAADVLASFGITPARYDMMIAIANGGERDGVSLGIAQRELRDLLCVSSPTISRMLRSLEKLGFVKRTPHPTKRRHKWCTLTASGLLRLKSAMEDIAPDLPWMTDEFINPEPENSVTGRPALGAAIDMLNLACERLHHVGTLVFPYDLPRAA